MELKGLRVTPSNTHRPLLLADRFTVACTLRYPQLWNAVYEWHFDMGAEAAKIFFLMDHATFFADLAADWALYGEWIYALEQQAAAPTDRRRKGDKKTLRGDRRSLDFFIPVSTRLPLPPVNASRLLRDRCGGLTE